MISRRFLRVALLALGSLIATTVFAADAVPRQQKIVPVITDLTNEQQTRILQAFGRAEPQLQTFAINFPSAPFVVSREAPKSSKISITTFIGLGRYSIALFFSGTFDAGFTKLSDSKCDLFGAYDNRKPMKDGEARAPLRLKLEDMEEFCDNPYAYLEKQFEPPKKS